MLISRYVVAIGSLELLAECCPCSWSTPPRRRGRAALMRHGRLCGVTEFVASAPW